MEDRKSQFCHAAAKKCCGSGNLLIYVPCVNMHVQEETYECVYMPRALVYPNKSFTFCYEPEFKIHKDPCFVAEITADHLVIIKLQGFKDKH